MCKVWIVLTDRPEANTGSCHGRNIFEILIMNEYNALENVPRFLPLSSGVLVTRTLVLSHLD